MNVSFVLTGEGSSDLRLVEHIKTVLLNEGFDEVSGEAANLSGLKDPVGTSVSNRLCEVVKRYPDVDLIFVHRDADGFGLRPRCEEVISAASIHVSSDRPLVLPVIPVRALESWLLADQEKIHIVAGNRRSKDGRINCIPSMSRLESVSDPKALLEQALCDASGTAGGKLRKFKSRFYEMRARLTEALDPDGPVGELESYQEFRGRIREAVVTLTSGGAAV